MFKRVLLHLNVLKAKKANPARPTRAAPLHTNPAPSDVPHVTVEKAMAAERSSVSVLMRPMLNDWKAMRGSAMKAVTPTTRTATAIR